MFRGYTDYVEMLKKEKPDIIHAVTEPTVPRHIWVEPAAEAGVKALVIEKPLALRPSEAEGPRHRTRENRFEDYRQSPTPVSTFRRKVTGVLCRR